MHFILISLCESVFFLLPLGSKSSNLQLVSFFLRSVFFAHNFDLIILIFLQISALSFSYLLYHFNNFHIRNNRYYLARYHKFFKITDFCKIENSKHAINFHLCQQ